MRSHSIHHHSARVERILKQLRSLTTLDRILYDIFPFNMFDRFCSTRTLTLRTVRMLEGQSKRRCDSELTHSFRLFSVAKRNSADG